jgi:hypothetical protein
MSINLYALNRKIHLAVDSHGQLRIDVKVTTDVLCADKGYDSEPLREQQQCRPTMTGIYTSALQD